MWIEIMSNEATGMFTRCFYTTCRSLSLVLTECDWLSVLLIFEDDDDKEEVVILPCLMLKEIGHAFASQLATDEAWNEKERD